MASSSFLLLATALAIISLVGAQPAISVWTFQGLTILPGSLSLFLASRTRIFTAADCQTFYNIAGTPIAVQRPTDFSGWNCSIITGDGYPSVMQLNIFMQGTTGQNPTNHGLLAIYQAYKDNTAYFTHFMTQLTPGCAAEAAYLDSMKQSIVVGPGPINRMVPRDTYITLNISTGVCPTPVPTPATQYCSAVFTVTAAGPVAARAPTDNCMRIFNAAQPFAAAAGVTMAPWCTDLGTVSGVVSFKAPIITPAQYNSLVDQFRRTNMAQAMAAALNLDPCTTSVSIAPESCGNLETLIANTKTTPSLFPCVSPPSPPPKPVYSPPPPKEVDPDHGTLCPPPPRPPCKWCKNGRKLVA